MKKSKKIILNSLILGTLAISAIVAIPVIIKNQNIVKNFPLSKENEILKIEKIKKSYNIFINSKPIRKTLEVLFRHENNPKESIAQYVDNQYKLLFSNKHNSIRSKLFFINGITNSLNQQDIISGLKEEKRPYFKRNNSKHFENEFNKMLTDDWLWFLYNITCFKFAFTPNQGDLYDQNLENIIKMSRDIGAFYNPQSNILIDYSHQTIIEDIDSNSITYTFDYLTSEGFILHFEIRKEIIEKNGKRIEGKVLHKDILPIMYTFSKIRKSKNILRDFDIRKYSSVFSDFQNLENRLIKRNIFEEKHGGKRLTFSLYCMQNQ